MPPQAGAGVVAHQEGGSEERRWEFEIRGSESYSERLLTRTADGWELLTEWVFERASLEAE